MSIVDPITGLRTPVGIVPGMTTAPRFGYTPPPASIASSLASQVASAGAAGAGGVVPPVLPPVTNLRSGAGWPSNFNLFPRTTQFATKHPLAARTLPVLAAQILTAQDVVGGHGNVEAFGRGAVTGGAVGASIGAPLFGVGAVPAGAVGALVGGVGSTLYNTFFGEEDKPSPKEKLSELASKLGLDPTNYTTLFDLQKEFGGGDEKQLGQQLAEQILVDYQTQQQQTLALEQAQQQRSADQRFALAMQAQAQKFFTPTVNNIITAGQTQADLLTSLAEQLPEPYRALYANQAEQARSSSQSIASAYAAQASNLPSQYMYSMDLRRAEELARLQYNQSLLDAQTAGGAQDFATYSQQLANQSAGG